MDAHPEDCITNLGVCITFLYYKIGSLSYKCITNQWFCNTILYYISIVLYYKNPGEISRILIWSEGRDSFQYNVSIYLNTMILSEKKSIRVMSETVLYYNVLHFLSYIVVTLFSNYYHYHYHSI